MSTVLYLVSPATTGRDAVLVPEGVNCLNPPGATSEEEGRFCQNKPGEIISAGGCGDAEAPNPRCGKKGCLVTVAAGWSIL